jgi:peptidoglycan/xylan/chitin deacetylase (PgdA/CDA1 family)
MFWSLILSFFFRLLLASSFSFAQSIQSPIIEHGSRTSNKIALTFDACPTSRPDEYDERVVEVLLREKVPATLFVSGRWVEKNQGKARFLALQRQFEIAAHSFHHPHMTLQTDDRDIREFARTQAVIRKVTGITPKYFRPPYGEVDERVARLAANAGLITIQYDISSGDPDGGLPPQRIVRSILNQAQGGSIIVFHMNKNGVHTAEILPEIISGLRNKGFALVTVGELLQQKPKVTTEAWSNPATRKRSVQRVSLLASHPVPGDPSGY